MDSHVRNVVVQLSLAACAVGAGVASAQPTAGPDVIVGDIVSPTAWGQFTGISAFSVGTVSCNKGDTPINWYTDGTFPAQPELWNDHPVILQNLYRWRVFSGAGHFDQIGMSFGKHAYSALQANACSFGCSANPNATRLGAGCSDPYSASLNGFQSYLGPRSQVNAFTGEFPYPFTAAPVDNTTIGRRLQARNTDVDPVINSGAMYFCEAQYVAPDDATAGNGLNNASYRRMATFFNAGANRFELLLVNGYSTVREQPAIFGWATAEAGVTILPVDVPGEGRFFLGFKVTHLAGGSYHYEYALFNLNSDRSGSSFSLNLPEGDASCVTTAGAAFHAPFYHSGEPYDATDWAYSTSPTSLGWACTQTYAQNSNANALRWSTMDTFRLDSPRPPVNASATVGLFKPGTPARVTIDGVPVPSPCPCRSDYNQDGARDLSDVLDLADDIASGTVSFPPSSPDINADGSADMSDVFDLVSLVSSGAC